MPDDLAAALAREKQLRGTSLNQTVIDLLRQGLGVTATRSNVWVASPGSGLKRSMMSLSPPSSAFVAYSHFKRGEANIARLLDRAEWIEVSAVVAGELSPDISQRFGRRPSDLA